MIGLISYGVNMLIHHDLVFSGTEQELALSCAALIVSLFYWLYFYLPERRIAAQQDESGEHARRSLIRKVFLYVVIFAGVVGVMAYGGITVYLVLQEVLNNTGTHQWDQIIKSGLQVVLFGVFLHITVPAQTGWPRSFNDIAGQAGSMPCRPRDGGRESAWDRNPTGMPPTGSRNFS